MLFARAPPSVMPTGSPSPPYKATPKLGFGGEDLPTKSFSIGGIKREAYFYALGYKKNILWAKFSEARRNKKSLLPTRKISYFQKIIPEN